MKTIRLFGDLEQFKPVWTLDVKTPAEALRAIDVQRDGFLAACDAGQYVAVLVKADQPELTRQVVNDNAHDPWADEELWVLPVVGGDIPIPIIAAAFAAMGVSVANFTLIAMVINTALSIAFSAVANLLTSKKKNTTAVAQERPENKPSFIADGPVNLTVAGHPHPILVGHVQDCGSMVLSSNYWVEDIPV
jgi:predicted phage tail protein